MKKKNFDEKIEIRANTVSGQPENVFELINKYGTYNIQPTAESDNQYPVIAQGYPECGDKSDGFPEASRNEKTAKRANEKGDKGARKLL